MVATLAQGLRRAHRRLSQRITAILRDLSRVDEAEAWVARAPWLVPAAARAPRGSRSLEVSDWSSGEEQTLHFPLDPSRPAREQVEAVFARARRLRRGKPIAEARLAEARRALDGVAALLGEIETIIARSRPRSGEAGDVPSEDPPTTELSEELIAEWATRGTALLPRDLRSLAAQPQGPPGRREQPSRKPPYRTFTARSGMRILVGRRAEFNDELTFQVSRPHHAWLHAKGLTGAHVIGEKAKGKPLTEDELVDAALLAAHFSDARDEPIVDVLYTERRYVRKPRRAPPGLVLADRAKVLVLRVDPAALQKLLATEIDE